MSAKTKVSRTLNNNTLRRRYVSWIPPLVALICIDNFGALPASSAPLNVPPDPNFNANTNFDGGTWTGSTTTMTFLSNVTATNNPANIFTYTANDGRINGTNSGALASGTLRNEGTFNFNISSLMRLRNGATFDNVGTLNFNNTSGRIYFDEGVGNTFRNLGGNININAPNILFDSNGTFTTYDGSTLYDLNLNVGAGDSFTLKAHGGAGQVRINMGTFNVGAGATLNYSSPSTVTVTGGGTITFNEAGRVNLGYFGMGNNVVFDSAAGQGLLGGTIANNGNNMTIQAGRTLTFDGSQGEVRYQGSGSFINNGTFDYNTGSLFRPSGNSSFDNYGILNFNNNGGRIYFDDGGSNKFRNLGGTINVNANNILFDSNGLLTTYDGSTLYDLNINVAAGKDFTIKAHATGGQVQLGTITVGAGGALTLSSPSLFTKNGGGTITFNQPGKVSLGWFGMGNNVVLDAGGNHDLLGGTIANNGFNMTLETGRTATFTGGISELRFQGAGSFINKGDFNYNTGQLFRPSGNSSFDNYGTLTFNNNNGRMYFDDGGSNKFRNLGGTINVNANNILFDSNGLLTTFDGSTLYDLNINVAAGKDFTIKAHAAGGQVQLGTITVGAGGALTLSSPSLFTKNGGGTITFNQPGKVSLGWFTMGNNVVLDAGGNSDLLGGTIKNNGYNLTLETGRTATFTGGISELRFQGTGSFINKGNIDINTTQLFRPGNGATINNQGTFSMNANNARMYMADGSGNVFLNNTTGILTKAPGVAKVQIDGGSGTINNLGTILVPGGELEIQPMTFTQFSANSLTGGTYTIDSTLTGSALLDLQPANAGITTIGTNAKVNLIGSGASFTQLESSLNTLNGQLKLSEGKVLNLNNLTMSSTSQLTFGLDDLASSNSKINLTGSLSANGLINIENLGGLELGVYDLISVNGLFTDNGLALGSVPPGFDGTIYNLKLLLPASGSFNGIVQLSVEMVPAPEPGSATLLGLGLVGAVYFRRRRRTANKA